MKQCVKNLEANGFIVKRAKNKQEALEFAKTQITNNISIGLGGSTTVQQIGLLDYLIGLKNIKLFNQYENGISIEENNNRRREGLLSDLYITGTNAITKQGEIVNVDGSGNRVAAQIYGPHKVLLFAGVNKIVENLDDAIKRINEIAITKNLKRINEQATIFGKKKYTTKTLANKYTMINGEEQGRTTIVLIEEELGF